MSNETSGLGDVCDWCGGEIQQPPTGRRRAYCSRTHREYAYRARREQRLMLRAYSKGKADAESWASVSTTDASVAPVVETVPSVDETAPPAPMPDPGGVIASWRAAWQLPPQAGEPDGRPTAEPR